MIAITLTVDKKGVYREVAKTTSYTGAKMDDANAYDRIFTTDENSEMLERFWQESRIAACNSLKRFLQSETEADGVYSLALELSGSYNEALTESMQRSLFSFFVMNITAKWYTLANKNEAEGYASEAATYMEDIRRKCFYKKSPTRPKYYKAEWERV